MIGKGPVKADQIQIMFLGHGYGESMLVHFGDNNWVLVDSCFGEFVGEEHTVALVCLNSRGVNLETQVKLVLVSHWHENHFLGISRLIEDCKSAKFCVFFKSVYLTKSDVGVAIFYNGHNIYKYV